MNLSSSCSIRSRKQTLLRRRLSTPSFIATCGGGSTAAEFCGGATATCAVLCCCGPCTVVKLVVLAVYKVPRGICRRTIRRLRRRRLIKKGILSPTTENGDCEKRMNRLGSSQFAVHPLEGKEEKDLDIVVTALEEEEDEAVMALEKEMWNRFYSGGFWRSLSQAETVSFPSIA